MTVRSALLLALSAASCAPEPFCGQIDLGPMSVDTSSGTPVFDWRGSAADFDVLDEEGETLWSFRCNCSAEQRRPDSNAGCHDTLADYEFRHCLSGPVTYGELPDIDTLVQPEDYDGTMIKPEAAALHSGTRYEARATAYCNGDGRDPNSIVRTASFVAP